MKKAMLIFAASLTLAACGGSSEQTSTDSVSVDSTVVVDTTVVADTVIGEGGKPAHDQPIK
jgi:ABC-type glycerol-3-phosphate transport system substrate-binding protein